MSTWRSDGSQVQKTVQWQLTKATLPIGKTHGVQMVPTCDQYATLDSQVAAPAVDPLFKRKRKGKDKELELTPCDTVSLHKGKGQP